MDSGFYNMDCMVEMKKLLANNIIADCMLTDIPYDEVNRESNGLRELDKKNADIMTFDLLDFLELADKVVSGVFIIFCGKGQSSTIFNFFANKGYSVRLLVWQKNNPSPMNGEHIYLSGIEVAVYAKKKGGTFNGFCKNTVFKHNTAKKEIHDTQKPLSLWYELINDNTNEGQTVLDPCAGSGTTAVACHKLNRKYICYEKDPDYYALATARLEAVKAQMTFFDTEE